MTQRAGIKRKGYRRVRFLSTGNQESCLRKAVTSLKRGLPEPIWGECRDKVAKSTGAYRFCAVECGLPATEVQSLGFSRIKTAYTQSIGKVGTAAHGRSMAGNRLQPQRRPLNKSARRHQYRCKTTEDRLQNAADQTHIVIGRQPKHC